MSKDIKKTQKIRNNYFRKFRQHIKIGIFAIIVISILGNFYLFSSNMVLHHKLKKTKKEYSNDMERTTKEYQKVIDEKDNLLSEIQDLNFKFTELNNSKIELELLIEQLNDENVTLYSIREELVKGINNTNYQIKMMQKSVGTIIDEKQTELDKKEKNIRN